MIELALMPPDAVIFPAPLMIKEPVIKADPENGKPTASIKPSLFILELKIFPIY